MWLSGKKPFYFLVIGIVCAASAIAYIYQDDSLARIRQDEVIRIGYALEPPYAFLADDGQVSGESPEVARQIITRLGIARIEWRLVDFSELIDDLNQGHIDVIAAGMFITPQRNKRVRFSEPSFHVQQGLLVAKGNPLDLHSYQQAVKKTGVRLAVLTGSIEEQLLQKLGMADDRLLRVPDAQTGKAAIETGQADGLALSQPSLRWAIKQSPMAAIELASPFAQPDPSGFRHQGYGAFAFRSGDQQLLAAWNEAMKEYINSPAHERLMARFGFSREETPGNIRTEEVLAQ